MEQKEIMIVVLVVAGVFLFYNHVQPTGYQAFFGPRIEADAAGGGAAPWKNLETGDSGGVRRFVTSPQPESAGQDRVLNYRSGAYRGCSCVIDEDCRRDCPSYDVCDRRTNTCVVRAAY